MLSNTANAGAIENHLLEGPRVHAGEKARASPYPGGESSSVNVDDLSLSLKGALSAPGLGAFAWGRRGYEGCGWTASLDGMAQAAPCSSPPDKQADTRTPPPVLRSAPLRLQCCLHGSGQTKST